MIALQITATTPHGVVLSRPWGVAFDGLFASVLWHRRKWAARAAGEHFTYRHSDTPETLELPLARCGDPDNDGDWHWMATFADLHPRPHNTAEPDIRWRTSRTDRHRLQHLTPIIGRQAVSDSTGRYQRRIVPVLAHPATKLTWRAVGDPDLIRDLLTELPLIGKHRGVGEGRRHALGCHRNLGCARVGGRPRTRAGRSGSHRSATLPRKQHCAPDPHGRRGSGVRPPYLHPVSRTAAYQPAR